MNREGRHAGDATILQWAGQAADRMQRAGLFFGHGTATSFDEACRMVSQSRGLAPEFDVHVRGLGGGEG